MDTEVRPQKIFLTALSDRCIANNTQVFEIGAGVPRRHVQRRDYPPPPPYTPRDEGTYVATDRCDILLMWGEYVQLVRPERPLLLGPRLREVLWAMDVSVR